jgi:hypothetical protein
MSINIVQNLLEPECDQAGRLFNNVLVSTRSSLITSTFFVTVQC